MSYEEQIMSKGKYWYPSIFRPQMEAIVFIILQILFCNMRSFREPSCDVFRPIMRKRKYLMDYKYGLSRWLDIGLVLFLRIYRPRRSRGP